MDFARQAQGFTLRRDRFLDSSSGAIERTHSKNHYAR